MAVDAEIPVSFEGLDDIDQNTLQSVVKAIIEKYAVDLDLERTIEVRITADLPETLRRFSEEHGSRYHHTSNPLATGVAQAYRRIIDGRFEHHLLLDKNISEYLLASNDDEFAFGGYILLHELCHIDDANRISKASPKGWLAPTPNHKTSILIDIANGCWAEYYADRRSAKLSALMGGGCQQFD